MCYCDCVNGLATVAFDNRILVWAVSLPNNKPISVTDSVRPHLGTLSSVACIEHSRSIVTLDGRGMFKIWDLRSFLCTQTVNCAPYVPVQDSASKFFRVVVSHRPPSVSSPLGVTQLLIFSRKRLFAFEYNLSQRAVILRNTADDEPILFVGYSVVEQLYVTVSLSKVKIWDSSSSTVRDMFVCPTAIALGGISSAHLHPNGRAYYLGTQHGAILAKNFSTGSTIYVAYQCHHSPCIALRYCYAAMLPPSRTGQQTQQRAGLGDILVSIADDSVRVLVWISKMTSD